jgi:hypothetical protein
MSGREFALQCYNCRAKTESGNVYDDQAGAMRAVALLQKGAPNRIHAFRCVCCGRFHVGRTGARLALRHRRGTKGVDQ